MTSNSRSRKKFKYVEFFAAHRPTGESLRAKLARADQDPASRPVPSLARVRFLEQPLPRDDDWVKLGDVCDSVSKKMARMDDR